MESAVLLHLLQQHRRDIPVLFLDTLHHFQETLEYATELARRWDLNLITLRAPEPAKGLWRHSTDDCCTRHKVEPLFAALDEYDVWFTGRRREQSPSRTLMSESELFRLPTGHALRKFNPLATWSERDVLDYVEEYDIPLLPLYARGYTSIGCEPCTSLPLDPANGRSGRWRGQKLECGLHLQPVQWHLTASRQGFR
jgi:phosphoadenosine phosphosulfate reductase